MGRANFGFALLVWVTACHHPAPAPIAPGPDPLSPVEAQYAELRDLKDQIDVTQARGASASTHGRALPDLETDYLHAREQVVRGLAAVPSPTDSNDRDALSRMQRALEIDLPAALTAAAPAVATTCEYDPETVGDGSAAALTARLYACYGRAAEDITVGDEHLNRLTVLGRVGREADPGKRRRLFLALEPVWRSVNSDDRETSPWRVLLRRNAESWQQSGLPSRRHMEQLGIDPSRAEEWLTLALAKWRDQQPDSLLEPWDFYFAMGAASRALSSGISLPDLSRINRAWYLALGADPVRLNVQYDMVPRIGKEPVAYTTFGARPHRADSGWTTGEPWVFTSYEVGGFDNLAELLHETGHAIHIAAIRTRPGWADWPESDTFTEAIADLAALDIDEPAWQWRFLGDSAPLQASLQARYAGIVMDMAWALFEIRMQREPSLDPNQVWSDLTREYLRIRPHPELSWWAMRGQLIDSPGYLLNYAVGAFIVADLRAAIRARHGSYTAGDSTWYPWVSERLYRFGLERSAREVLVGFLGRGVTPDALLADLGRLSR